MRIQLSDHFNYKKLLAFVMPSVVMMTFTSIYGVVDGLFVSNFVGKEAVAAINRIYPLILILGSIGFMLGAGGSALISKTLGEGDKDRANAYFSMLVYVTLGLGTVIAVAGQFAVPSVARLLGAKGITYDYCVLYGRFLLAGQPFFILQNIFQSFFVTAEKPRLGLLATVAAGVMNMALDAVFVAGLKWGLTGAAAATVASQVLGGVFPIIYFVRKNDSLLRLTKTKIYFRALIRSFANGSSEFLSNVSASVVTMLYNFQLDKFAGDAGVAAYGVILYVAMIFYAVFMGYAIGSAPLIGYDRACRSFGGAAFENVCRLRRGTVCNDLTRVQNLRPGVYDNGFQYIRLVAVYRAQQRPGFGGRVVFADACVPDNRGNGLSDILGTGRGMVGDLLCGAFFACYNRRVRSGVQEEIRLLLICCKINENNYNFSLFLNKSSIFLIAY